MLRPLISHRLLYFLNRLLQPATPQPQPIALRRHATPRLSDIAASFSRWLASRFNTGQPMRQPE